MHLFGGGTRCLDRICGIARDHVPLQRLRKGLVKNRVDLLDGGWREARVELVAIESLHVRRGQLRELDAPERGLEVEPDYLLVTLVGARPYAAPVGVVQPPIQILTDGHVLSVECVPACAVGERFGQLVGYLLARLAVEPPALRALRRMCRVLCLPAPILALGDRALAVSASTHCLPPSSVLLVPRPMLRIACVSCGAAPAACRFPGGLSCRRLSPSCGTTPAGIAHARV